MKGKAWIDRWHGQTVVCIGSGPSLTDEDCAAVHASGMPTIVTNTSFRRCLWASVLFGFDGKWWDAKDDESKRLGFANYAAEACATFKGERVTCSIRGRTLGAEDIWQQGLCTWFRPYGNSGTGAISLAVVGGARRIVLIGYDCQRTAGKTHWHGDHPKMIGNAISMPNWPKLFANVAKFAATRKVQVLNCSRATALKCFERGDLAEALR